MRALWIALLFAPTALVHAQSERVLVRFHDAPDGAIVSAHGGTVLRHLDSDHVLIARIPASSVNKLRRLPGVISIEQDGIVSIQQRGGRGGGGGKKPKTPPPQVVPWGTLRCGGPAFATGIKVAIIDTGIDRDHPDLAANYKGGTNFVKVGTPPEDDNGHGSHVAGTIAAVDNSIGVVGIAKGASIYAIKALDRRGRGFWSDIASGVDYARLNEMDLVNMSLGGSAAPSYLQTACAAAAGDGVLILASSGNNGDNNTATDEMNVPASYTSVVPVGATDSLDRLVGFSATGPHLKLRGVSGPGVGVLSTSKNGGYKTMDGTSMACPHATAVAAVIWSSLSSSTASSSLVLAALRSRARDVDENGDDNGFGAGIVVR